MVRAPTAGPSRAPSSAAGSVARDILKKRDKPYKTELQKVMAKKQRLNLNTSYQKAPEGYSFLPVGTPDLADLCKKLSKKRDLPVSVVNTRPTNKMATDPSKLSHHVHRIGYHFHSEVLEQAVAELNYTMHKGRFVKEEDLAKKRQESLTAQILLKHGIRMNEWTNEESHQQVRAAIKELFPKIPDDDLEGIVKHAWEEGSGRVGSAQALDLPRRVQLAVIARIRHKYTDYDRLLRAFEWKEARQMTEPVSLQKLIEWRGEQDAEDDGQLEEMVRETIVIDDDEDDDSATLADGSEADDEDSAAEQGDNSDASIEIINHLADDTDIGGESTYETRRPAFRRPQPRPRRSQRLNDVARQKIAAARGNTRGAQISYEHPPEQEDPLLTDDSTIPTVQIQHGPNASGFQMGGQPYQRVMPPSANTRAVRSADALQVQEVSSASTTPASSRPLQHWHAPQYPSQPALPPFPASDVTYNPGMRYRPPVQDRPVASIERDEGYRDASSGNAFGAPSAQAHRRPITPEPAHSSKRRRIDPVARHGLSAAYKADVVDLTTPEQPRHRALVPKHGEIVDLMTPEPAYQPVHPSPLREVRNAPLNYDRVDPQPRYQQMHPVATPAYNPSPARYSSPGQMRSDGIVQDDGDDLAYDPRQPMLQLPQQVDRLSIRPEQSHRPAFNPPGAWPVSPAQPPPQPPPPAQYYYAMPPQQPAVQQAIPPQPIYTYPPAPPPRLVYEQQQPSRPTPQPVHGAPAPVQVLPRYAPQQGYGRPPTVPPPQPPTDGAPAPVQVLPRYAPHNGYG